MIYDRNNPFPARLKSRIRVSGEQSDKNVQLLAFDISNSDLTYECGDSIAIFPKNDPIEISKILALLKVQPDARVKFPNSDIATSVFSALCENCDIINLSKKFLQWFADYLNDSGVEFLNKEMLGSGEQCPTNIKSFSLLELLNIVQISRPIDVQGMVNNLKRLTPRLYSIASSPSQHRDEVHILVREVTYTNAVGHQRHGIASTYLTRRVNIASDITKVFIVHSHFSLPEDPLTNIILVGPGTGLAPFLGFLEERYWLQNTGTSIGKSWLFFGDRHRATDFLCQNILLNYEKIGVLTHLSLAFSRDQDTKIYVQDRIWEARETIWKWINDGAHIYICGEAAHMAKDVEFTLKKIAIEVGHIDPHDVEDFFKNLRQNKRFLKDVY